MVVAAQYDGRRDFAAANGVVTLGLSGEPVMLRYRDSADKLARSHAPAAIAIDPKQNVSILKGASRRVVVTGPNLRASDLRAKLPPRWEAKFAQRGKDVVMTVTAPKATEARTGRVMVQRLANGAPCAEIILPMPIMSPIGVTTVAAPRNAAGEPGVVSTFVNNAAEPKDVTWTVELTGAWKIAGGTFLTNLSDYNAEDNTLQAEIRHRITLTPAAVAALEVGGTLMLGQESIKIETLVRDGDTTVVNDEIYLETWGSEVRAYFYDMEYMETTAVLTLKVPEGLIFLDHIDPASGESLETPTEHTAEEFVAMLASGEAPDFSSDNVYVIYDENGEMAQIDRYYTPWQ